METIKIMTDSSSGITQQEGLELDIDVVPLPVIVDKQNYLDGIDLFYEDIVNHLKSHQDIKTSQPLPGEIMNHWDEQLKTYDKVLYIPLSSALSGSFATASALASHYEGRVVVVDALAVEVPLRLVCMQAKQLVKQGKSALEIRDLLESRTEQIYALLVPHNMEQFKRSGRITPAAAAVANLLKIQIILKIQDGKVDLFNKVRTLSKALQETLAALLQVDDPNNYEWAMVHADYEGIEELKTEFESLIQQKVELHRFSPVVMAHTGVKTVGIGRVRKLDH